MTATIEISLYPLTEHYPEVVLQFLKRLKNIPGVDMETNGMSTILIGDYSILWHHLGKMMEAEMESGSSLFVMKVAPGRREFK